MNKNIKTIHIILINNSYLRGNTNIKKTVYLYNPTELKT
jgi:hypothetical protein